MMWTKNERTGRVDQIKGKVKQAAGRLTRNDNLTVEGRVEEAVGTVKVALGRTSRKTGDAITRVGHAVKR